MTDRPLAVFDIDGTVADVRHRLHWLAGHPTHAEWVEFFAAAVEDVPLADGVDLVRQYAATHDIAWLTGRPERIRDLTQRWLRNHDLPDAPLFMQPEGDRRLARHVKLGHLDKLAACRWISVVVDDDPVVVDLLRQHRYPAQLADWPPATDGKSRGPSPAGSKRGSRQ